MTGDSNKESVMDKDVDAEGKESGDSDTENVSSDLNDKNKLSSDNPNQENDKDKKPDNSDDIAKLSEVARKERELRRAAERKLSDLEKGKMTVEERIAQLEKQNKEQSILLKRDALVKEMSSGVEKGFKVNHDKVNEMLSLVSLTDDNIDSSVKKIVKICTEQDTALDLPENKQSRSDTYTPEDAMKIQITDVF